MDEATFLIPFMSIWLNWANFSEKRFTPLHSFDSRKAMYPRAIQRKCCVLDICTGFIDGPLFGIARPRMFDSQHAACNRHKRKHALKIESDTTPDGLVYQVFWSKVTSWFGTWYHIHNGRAASNSVPCQESSEQPTWRQWLQPSTFPRCPVCWAQLKWSHARN